MLNGRTKSDRLGKATYTGPFGKSVLDLAIAHHDALADMQIEEIDVGPTCRSTHHAILVGIFAPQEYAQQLQATSVVEPAA